MPRRHSRTPADDAEPLFSVADSPSGNRSSRHSAAFARAIKAAGERGLLEDVDGAVASLAMAGAWSLDAFEQQNKPYGPSKIVGELREVLSSMNMTPEARNTETDANIADLVTRLETMDTEDADATPSHPE